jgi:hypothetical protein
MESKTEHKRAGRKGGEARARERKPAGKKETGHGTEHKMAEVHVHHHHHHHTGGKMAAKKK